MMAMLQLSLTSPRRLSLREYSVVGHIYWG
jgi:hypothetical protein